MKEIIDNDIAPLFRKHDYNGSVVAGVNKIVDVTTVPVSFFTWYKWYILAGIAACISLIIALVIDKKKGAPLFWVLLGMAGFLILGMFKGISDGESSDGFGGGSSDGGGASGGD